MERTSVRTGRALWQRALSVSRSSARDATGAGGGGGGAGGGSGGGGCNGGSSSGGIMLKGRTTSFHALASSLLEQKNREKDLKAKAEELEDVKSRLQQERDGKQKSEKQVQSLQNSLQDVQSKLHRSLDVGEKLRMENKKKTEQVEKLERNVSHMEDRIRNLEIRASEVEKAELTLESTRRNLENIQHECRAKEGEIVRLQDRHDKTCLELEQAQNNIRELEKKMEDLKHQVRYELMKNENIEKGLETIPHLKDDIEERDKTIALLHKEMDDKTALLAASRKAVRDFKDRIRDLERGEAAGENLRKEVELAKSEVLTLKQLIVGKDALLLRKGQALEQAKMVIESLPRSQEEKEKVKKMQQILTQLSIIQHENHTHANGLPQCDVNGNKGIGQPKPLTPRHRTGQDGGGRELSVDHAPYQRDPDYTALLERCLQENHPGDCGSAPTTQTAVVHPVRRSSSAHTADHHHHYHPPSRSRHSPRASSINSNTNNNNNISRGSGSRELPSRLSSANVYRPETRASSKFPPSLDYPLVGGTADENDGSWAHVTGNSHHHPPPLPLSHGPLKPRRPYSAVNSSQKETELHSDLTSLSSQDTEDSETGCGGGGGNNHSQSSSSSSKDEAALAQMKLSARQKDEVLTAAISIGDRVSFTVPQKPPRYGRKKPKPLVYTGIVKYVGRLDNDHFDARVYCGVRLDEPMGEKDGVYKGKRYMFTPQDHAKFFKIRDVTSILDVKSGQYLSTSRLLLKHLKKSQSFHRDELISRTM